MAWSERRRTTPRHISSIYSNPEFQTIEVRPVTGVLGYSEELGGYRALHDADVLGVPRGDQGIRWRRHRGRPVLSAEDQKYLLEFEPSVTHYEIFE